MLLVVRLYFQAVGDLHSTCRAVFELTHDLVVLEEAEDVRRKVSEPLLDSMLAVLDSMAVFHHGSPGRQYSGCGNFQESLPSVG
jgi:hypothetical protein